MKRVKSQNEVKQICGYSRFIISMLLVFITLGINASTIHWITFINTDDPNVGEFDKNARSVLYGRFINTVSSEVSQYGYECKFYDYYSGNFSPTECIYCISNLKCAPSDIVVFYFIGHGFRPTENNAGSKYPYMFFDDNCNNSIPLSWVHQSLKNKGAQLTLTFAVCDNSYLGADCKPSIEGVLLPSIAKHEVNTNTISDGHSDSAISNAFLGYRGDMVICSTSPGQHTWGGQTELGSMDIFTYSLITLFDKAQSENVLSWPAFLEELSSQISNATKDSPVRSIQIPTYDYDIKQIQMHKKRD